MNNWKTKKRYGWKIVNNGEYTPSSNAVDPTSIFSIDIAAKKIFLYTSIKKYSSGSHYVTGNINLDFSSSRRGIDNYHYILVNVCSGDWNSRNSWYYERKGAFLISITENQATADRVPTRCETVQEAIDFMKPSEVKKAIKEKRKVYRQGDFFFVEKKSGTHNLKALDGSHNVLETDNDNSLKIMHNQHNCLELPNNVSWKAVQRKVLAETAYKD